MNDKSKSTNSSNSVKITRTQRTVLERLANGEVLYVNWDKGNAHVAVYEKEFTTTVSKSTVDALIDADLIDNKYRPFHYRGNGTYLIFEITEAGHGALKGGHKTADSARELQQPGQELYRHDLTVHFFSKHPCLIPVFQAQIDACETDDEAEEVCRQWWSDHVPAYVRYSNTNVERARSRYERNHVRIAQAAAQMRGGL